MSKSSGGISREKYLAEARNQTGVFHLYDVNENLKPRHRLSKRSAEWVLTRNNFEPVGEMTWKKKSNGGAE